MACLTGVVANVCVDCESADVVRVNHVGVPLLAVAGVMEDVIHRLRPHIFTHNTHLKPPHTEREKIVSFLKPYNLEP